MIQVKFFSEVYTTVLEERLNEFLKKDCRKIHDIKFQRNNDNSYAMVIYEDIPAFNGTVADTLTELLKKEYY